MIHLDIVVVIHRDQMKGKISNQIKTISVLIEIDDDDILDHAARFNRINVIIVNDQDHHHQSKKFERFEVSKFDDFFSRARRNRPSSRDRSPQQQATNVVRR